MYPRIQGIFFDEMIYEDTSAGSSYQASLTRYAHDAGCWPTVANPGAETPGRYFAAGAADVIVVHEGDSWPNEARLSGDYFGGYADYPPFTRGVLLYSQAKLDKPALKMVRKYVRWVYVTEAPYNPNDPAAANPWDRLSKHLEASASSSRKNDGADRCREVNECKDPTVRSSCKSPRSFAAPTSKSPHSQTNGPRANFSHPAIQDLVSRWSGLAMCSTARLSSRGKMPTSHAGAERSTEFPSRLVRHYGCSARQSLTAPSWLAEARVAPSGAKATALTRWEWPSSTSITWPVIGSQRRTLASLHPAARVRPSGENERPQIAGIGPLDRPPPRPCSDIPDRDVSPSSARRQERPVGGERQGRVCLGQAT